MEKKIGVYICSGCEIGESINVDKLAAIAQRKGAKVVKTHACLCGEEGNALLQNDVANEGVNTVVIAACSVRTMTDAFRIDVPILERVNLREHVVWSHEPKTDGTQATGRGLHRDGPHPAAENLYWVQARAITTLSNRNIFSNYIPREVFPGLIKPLIFSINVPLVNTVWINWISENGGSGDQAGGSDEILLLPGIFQHGGTRRYL